MGKTEREIKILNVNVEKMITKMKTKGFSFKGKYIQEIYTYNLPTIDKLYEKYVDILIKNDDDRGLIKLIKEINPCLTKKNILEIKKEIGNNDIIDFINERKDILKLKNKKIIKILYDNNKNFSKWIRLRRTGEQTTITIKKIINGKGEYKLDAVEEEEFDVPNLDCGLHFLEDLGYFVERYQKKMRIIYNYKNAEIVIDKWPKIKPYVEIEADTKIEIDEVVALLEFGPEKIKIINTDDIYLEKGIDIYAFKELDFDADELLEIEGYMNL